MSRFYGIDDANELLPDVVAIVDRLREQRSELTQLRDAGESASADDPELRRLSLRMRGIVDQMAADVAWLDDRDIVLRDIPTGLLDFPALVAGRQVWLCWRSGEERVAWWHGIDEGFGGRQPLATLPGESARA
jgi:hypothetical protein